LIAAAKECKALFELHDCGEQLMMELGAAEESVAIVSALHTLDVNALTEEAATKVLVGLGKYIA